MNSKEGNRLERKVTALVKLAEQLILANIDKFTAKELEKLKNVTKIAGTSSLDNEVYEAMPAFHDIMEMLDNAKPIKDKTPHIIDKDKFEFKMSHDELMKFLEPQDDEDALEELRDRMEAEGKDHLTDEQLRMVLDNRQRLRDELNDAMENHHNGVDDDDDDE